MIKYKFSKFFLIVEDDIEIASVLGDCLKETYPDCHVVLAKSEVDAKRKLALQEFDLIFIDLNLEKFDKGPAMTSTSKKSGVNIVEFIKDKNAFNKETPLIIATGNLDKESLLALRPHTKYFWIKPFSVSEKISDIVSIIEEADSSKGLKKKVANC